MQFTWIYREMITDTNMIMKLPYLYENGRYTTRKNDHVLDYIVLDLQEFPFYSIQQCEIHFF